RGSAQVQSAYLLNNVSLNSGLLSDNYTGINTSSIQEVAVLTGGYNAEYGNARSAIINVTTKEGAGTGIHGTVVGRFRPPGLYHFGRHIYSRQNYDWTHYDLAYWTAESQNQTSLFYKMNPDSLLAAWHLQITPSDTLADYDKRSEYENEATLYGSLTDKLGFLVSGRYKRAVGIFPQVIPYNSEFNAQTNLNYQLTPSIKLSVNGLYGGWESSELLAETNFNTLESARESQWLEPMVVTDPYDGFKYRLLGAIERQWPELRRWTQVAAKVTHTISANTFYEVQASFLRDKMDRSDRSGAIPEDKWSDRDDTRKMVNRFVDQSFFHFSDESASNSFLVKADVTSQVHLNHLMKAGTEFRTYDFRYRHWMAMYEGGQRWNLNNVFAGKPYEGALYAQDKIEFSGLIVNVGLRTDFFHQNREAPKYMFDPLAFQTTTPGHDPDEPNGIPGAPEKVRTKLRVALAPRIGISHPITDNTVLHFFYGHFYQRPSWTKMFGFPYINYTDNENT
ncbi:MAG: hypothetical protein ACRENG_25490, partial [bacterium]